MGSNSSDQSAVIIPEDLPCMRCGYNLRMLRADGKCPECGLEIVPSLDKFISDQEKLQRRLQDADPVWLKQILEGVIVVLLSALPLGLLVLIPPLPRSMIGAAFADSGLVQVCLGTTFWVMACYGFWKLLATERTTGKPRRSTACIFFRGAIVIYLLFMVWYALGIGFFPRSIPWRIQFRMQRWLSAWDGAIVLIGVGWTVAPIWHRSRSRMIALLAVPLSLVSAAGPLLAAAGLRAPRPDGNRQGFFLALIHPLFGSVHMHRWLARSLVTMPRWDMNSVLLWIICLAPYLWLLLLVVTMLKLRQAYCAASLQS